MTDLPAEIPDRLHTPAEDAIPEGRIRTGRWLVRADARG